VRATHELRRTHATWLRDNGVPLEIVQQRLGHKDPSTTQIYLGQVPDSEYVALAAINW
jgi:integrase